MSKSKGTFIRASTYLEHLDPSYLRYYYASKLSSGVDDIDLNFEDFIAKVNSDLVGKVVNIASRTARFAEKTGLAADLSRRRRSCSPRRPPTARAIAEAYDTCDYSPGDAPDHGRRRSGQRVSSNSRPPWKLRKDAVRRRDELRRRLHHRPESLPPTGRLPGPVLPRLAQQTGELLGDPITHWDQSQQPLLGTPVGKFTHMMQRVDPKRVEAMLAASAEPAEAETTADTLPFDTDAPLLAEPMAETISFEEFAKVDLRVARVIAAEDVAGAQKLLKLTLGLGGDNRRTVLAGIKGVYKPEDLVGRLVICAANLAPRKMKFGLSEGMIVAAGGGGGEIYLLAPDAGQPGHGSTAEDAESKGDEVHE